MCSIPSNRKRTLEETDEAQPPVKKQKSFIYHETFNSHLVFKTWLQSLDDSGLRVSVTIRSVKNLSPPQELAHISSQALRR